MNREKLLRNTNPSIKADSEDSGKLPEGIDRIKQKLSLPDSESVDNDRRNLLKTSGATGASALTALSGCGSNEDSDDTSTEDTETKEDTSESNEAPTVKGSIDSVGPGESVQFDIRASDPDKLDRVAIKYGDSKRVWKSPGAELEKTGRMQVEDPQETGGNAVFKASDGDKETTVLKLLDGGNPEFEEFSFGPTEESGEVRIHAEVTDNVGFAEGGDGNVDAWVVLDDNRVLEKNLDGTTGVIDARFKPDVEMNEFTGTIIGASAVFEDWNGNRLEAKDGIYVRKYPLLEETEYRIGGVIQPYTLQWRKPGMHNRSPAYANPNDNEDQGKDMETFKKELGLLTGHGMNRIQVEVPNTERTREANREFLRKTEELHTEVEIEPFYNASRWKDVEADEVRDLVKDHMGWIRENLIKRDNITTYEGRPVVESWGINSVTKEGVEEEIRKAYSGDEFEKDGYAALMDHMREELRVEGKGEPFIVTDAAHFGHPDSYFTQNPRVESLHKEADAITNWVGGAAYGNWQENEDKEPYATKDEMLTWLEETWEGYTKFGKKHGVHVVPRAQAGFNDASPPLSHTSDSRETERSPELLRESLELAKEYATTDLIDLPAVGNWEEATTILPGEMDGKKEGMEYLEEMKEFQSGETSDTV